MLPSEALLISVVEDDLSVRRSLGRLLRSLGMRARTFASGSELLDDEIRCEADCFIIDVHMPGMGGYELAGRLADLGTEAPVIFISARAEEMGRFQKESPLAFALLLKPFQEQEVVEAIHGAIEEQTSTA